MKDKLLFITFICGLLMFWTNGFAQVFEFQQCVETTLSKNPNIKISESQVKRSQYAHSSTKMSRLPQISLSLTASRSDNALNVFGMKLQQRQASFNDFGFAEFNNDASVQPKALNQPDPHNDIKTSVEVLIPIWNGGKISAYQEQTHKMLMAAKSANISVQQFLTFNVYKSYESVHTSKSYIDVANKAVEASKAYVKTTQNLVNQGIVVKSELLNAKVNLAKAQTLLEKAKGQKEIALGNLKMLMNKQDMVDFDVGKRITMTLPFETISELLEKALENNPRLEAKQLQTLSHKSAVRAEASSLYPSFNLMLRNDWNSEELNLGESSYTVAGVMSWKLTDFGVSKYKVDQAQEVANQQKSALNASRNELKFKTQKAWITLKVAQKQEHLSRVAQAQAQESNKLVLKRYKNGVSTLTEVLASQARLDKSRADLIQSIYEANLQRSTLRLLTGTMTLTSLEVTE